MARLRRRTFPPAVSALELATGYWGAQAVITATRLGVAEVLRTGPKRTEEIAAALGLHEPSVFRLLRSLAAVDIFREDPPRVFSHTPISRTLLRDSPDSVHGMVLMQGEAWHWNAYERMDHAVRTGKSSFEHVHGMPLFDYLQKHPESAEIFNEAMTGWLAQSALAVTRAYDFSRFGRVADIGGGQGQLLAAILREYPKVKGLHFDLPHVAASALPRFAALGLEQRCEFQSGSFFDSVPAGADAYVIKNILHDWDDESALRILKHLRGVVPPKTGRLLIVESVVPSGNAAHVGKLIDLEMMVCTHGGLERTRDEFRSLLARAGFELLAVHESAAVECVVEAARFAKNG